MIGRVHTKAEAKSYLRGGGSGSDRDKSSKLQQSGRRRLLEQGYDETAFEVVRRRLGERHLLGSEHCLPAPG